MKIPEQTKPKSRFSPFLKQSFVNGAVCCDVIAHGCIVGYSAVLLPQLDQPDAPIPLTEEDASWIASVMSIAMLIGIFITAPLMGRLGRKMAHYVVIITLLAAWFIFTFSYNVTMLIIARLLQGLSFGIFIPLRSILIGEYTSPKNRGAFLTVIALAQGLGILLVHLIGALVNWQRTALICALFPFTSLIMTIYSPESPSWLADKGRFEECKRVFRWLRGDGEEEELRDMIQAKMIACKKLDDPQEHPVRRLATIIKLKEFYKPIVITSHIYCVLSFSGGMILPNYSPIVISEIMGSKKYVDFWLVFLDMQRLLSNVAAVYVMNKIGRRTMMFSMLGLNIFYHLATAAYVYCRYAGLLPYDGLWISVVLLNMQYFSIGMGMIPLPTIIAGEIFPLAYRSIGGSISMISYSAFMFIALKTFIGLIDSFGLYGTYLLYAGILIYNLIVMWFMLPETKGKTLQEIENEFRGMSLKEIELEEIESKSLQDPSQTVIR